MGTSQESQMQWFVMRDLKRANAKLPAYKQLGEEGYCVFTPMTTRIIENRGRKTRVQVPFVRDLLFVLSVKEELDKAVRHTDTLQYRYVKGAPYGTVMTVPAREMDRFMAAISTVKTPRYYAPGEITAAMHGARVRIVSAGPINGFEGVLLKVRGSAKKRFLVELPGLLAASIEINPNDYIELLED